MIFLYLVPAALAVFALLFAYALCRAGSKRMPRPPALDDRLRRHAADDEME